MVRGRKGAHADVLEQIGTAGLVRARVDGVMHRLEEVPKLAVRKNHSIDAVVDRLVARSSSTERIDASVRTAVRMSGGNVVVLTHGDDGDSERLYSTTSACQGCGASYPEIEPRSFSFNSPFGACAQCGGTGFQPVEAADENDGGMTGRRPIPQCPDCDGRRLSPFSLSVTIGGQSIADVCEMPTAAILEWLKTVAIGGTSTDQRVAEPIVAEVTRRIGFLRDVGAEYLTLDRATRSLSGGELQRVRLASCVGSGLTGVCYVLDEPSIGLHPADHGKLLALIQNLRDAGNTIVIVEHDEETIAIADRVIDIGPGAGVGGGRLVAQGTPAEVAADPLSPTGEYLSGREKISLGRPRLPAAGAKTLGLSGVTIHNLHKVSVKIPLGRLVGVCGVSGSGKSSLIVDTLIPLVTAALNKRERRPGPTESTATGRITGLQHLDKIIPIDQSPIGRSGRSCPATFTGVLDPIRQTFATTRDAKALGFGPPRFSFNAVAGRCDLCKGAGVEKIEMRFLPDLLITCARCGGRRFNRQTLRVKFKGASVADILEMTVAETLSFFENQPKALKLLRSLDDAGLGYIRLGQPSPTLSGGEAQRLKLATELARPATGRTIYVLDEPTTGLHFADVQRLLAVLDRLVAAGNTVLVIEHHLGVLAACDHLIELGPGGGAAGGRVVAAGTPEEVAAVGESPTGRCLLR